MIVEFIGTEPHRGSEFATGFDLRLNESIVIPSKTGRIVPTQTSLSVPNDVIALLLPRSSICKRGVMMTNSVGLIDPDYRGIIGVPLYNYTDHDVAFEADERMCQVVFTKALIPEFMSVDAFSTTTTRGDGGFGHTGRK